MHDIMAQLNYEGEISLIGHYHGVLRPRILFYSSFSPPPPPPPLPHLLHVLPSAGQIPHRGPGPPLNTSPCHTSGFVSLISEMGETSLMPV